MQHKLIIEEFRPPVTADRLFEKDKCLEPMFGDAGQARTKARICRTDDCSNVKPHLHKTHCCVLYFSPRVRTQMQMSYCSSVIKIVCQFKCAFKSCHSETAQPKYTNYNSNRNKSPMCLQGYSDFLD